MRTTPVRIRLLVALAASLLAAGCGGSGGDGDSGSDARKVDRSGYFTKEQSESLNPALGEYDTAFRKLDTGHDACTRTAARLHAAGRDLKVTVQCHIDNTGGVIAALDDVHAAFDEIDGSDFRKACAAQLAETKTFIAEYRDAWKVVQGNWTAYASGKTVDQAKTQPHFDKAYTMSSEFVTTVIPDLGKACYTKDDRDAATAATTDESKDAKADANADE